VVVDDLRQGSLDRDREARPATPWRRRGPPRTSSSRPCAWPTAEFTVLWTSRGSPRSRTTTGGIAPPARSSPISSHPGWVATSGGSTPGVAREGTARGCHVTGRSSGPTSPPTPSSSCATTGPTPSSRRADLEALPFASAVVRPRDRDHRALHGGGRHARHA
jgi:hypothetical protein